MLQVDLRQGASRPRALERRALTFSSFSSFFPDYPFKHPQVKFDTKIFHPNVNREDGSVCEEMLSANWSPQTQMREVLGKL